MPALQILNWKPFERGTLQGFLKVKLTSGLILDGLTVHRKNERRWVGLPGRPQIDADGNAIRDDRGKIQYFPVCSFEDRDTGNRFSTVVIAALDEHCKSQSPPPPKEPPSREFDDEIPF